MAFTSYVSRWFQKRQLAPPDDPSWAAITNASVAGVSPRMAEQVAAVHACIDVISSALASLPPTIRISDSRKIVTDHPLARTLRSPNDSQTWADFLQWFIAQTLLYGNAVAIVEGERIIPIPWGSVSITETENRRLVYQVQEPSIGGAHRPLLSYLDTNVLHLRDRSDDGILGVSRLRRGGSAIAHASSLQDAATAVFANGVMPSGAIRVEGRLTPEQRAALSAQIQQQYAGAGNRSKVLLLDQSASWQTMDTTPEDAELLESRKFSVVEICRLFEVPPPLVQDYTNNTFTNAAMAGKWFAQFTLSAWARKFEQQFSLKMLEDGLELELDMSAFARGDLSERWAAYAIALANNVLTAQEVKGLEGW